MLDYLHVKNIAIIEEIEIDFSKGFSVLTGETGAGKSIIIGSINAVLGSRISKGFIRDGADYASIEAVFSNYSDQINGLLISYDIEVMEQLVLSRRMTKSGKSVFKANGQIINSEKVRELATFLIDIHSQLEHQSLLQKKYHIQLLDQFIEKDIHKLYTKLQEDYKAYRELKKGLLDEYNDPEYRKRQLSFLSFEINEIESAQLKIHEDQQLKEDYLKLSNFSKIEEACGMIDHTLNHGTHNGGIRSDVASAMSELQKVLKYDESINDLYLQLEQIDVLLTDFSRDLFDYSDDLTVDHEVLESVTVRLDLINKLKSKYGNTIEDILVFLENKQLEYNELIDYENQLLKNKEKIESLQNAIIMSCEQLSKHRKKGAKRLEKQIQDTLSELNLPHVKFVIDIKNKEKFTINGLDEVEFMIATNQSETLKPLNKIASGGELSRVMLAMKSILANHDEVGAMIFDEIDTGISGRTAQLVSEKMYHISKDKQLICITHLPQIAAMADEHYVIEKETVNNRQIVEIHPLDEEGIANELARLIGGKKITQSVMKSAKEMKDLATNHKMNIN